MSFTLAHNHNRREAQKTSIFAGTSKPTKKKHKKNNGFNNISSMDSSYSTVYLQKSIGNQAVQRLMHVDDARSDLEIATQPKLKVSRPGDAHEQEADKVADEVMKTSLPRESNVKLSSPPMSNNEQLDRKCSACKINKEEEGKLNVNRKPSSNSSDLGASGEIANQINNVRAGSSSGLPLDFSTRQFMESRFGHDFSKVRIHTGEMAARSANSVNANAYTIGEHIVFEQGQYQPHTSEGRRLLAHELTHVVQQSNNNNTASRSAASTASLVISKISSSEKISRQKSPTVAPVVGLEEQFEQAILKSDWPYAVDRLATFNITEIVKLLERYVNTESALNQLKKAALSKFGSDETRIVPAINTLIETKFRVTTTKK